MLSVAAPLASPSEYLPHGNSIDQKQGLSALWFLEGPQSPHMWSPQPFPRARENHRRSCMWEHFVYSKELGNCSLLPMGLLFVCNRNNVDLRKPLLVSSVLDSIAQAQNITSRLLI